MPPTSTFPMKIRNTLKATEIFPVAYINDVGGGSHIVNDLTERDAIPNEHRIEGQIVTVIDDGINPKYTQYRLEGGINNTNWVLYKATGGSGLEPDSLLAGLGIEIEYKDISKQYIISTVNNIDNNDITDVNEITSIQDNGDISDIEDINQSLSNGDIEDFEICDCDDNMGGGMPDTIDGGLI